MPKYVGPFEVKNMVGQAAVHLKLTDGYERLHHTFHVSMTKPWHAREGQESVPVPHVPLLWSGGLPVMKIKAILDHRVAPLKKGHGADRHVVPGKFRIIAYHVRWQGISSERDEWEPVGVLDTSNSVIVAYKLAHELNGAEYV